MEEQLFRQQRDRLQKDIRDYRDKSPEGNIKIDKLSREGFLELFSKYGLSLIRSTNSRKDYTKDDKWNHLTKDLPKPRNSKNLIDPCND